MLRTRLIENESSEAGTVMRYHLKEQYNYERHAGSHNKPLQVKLAKCAQNRPRCVRRIN